MLGASLGLLVGRFFGWMFDDEFGRVATCCDMMSDLVPLGPLISDEKNRHVKHV